MQVGVYVNDKRIVEIGCKNMDKISELPDELLLKVLLLLPTKLAVSTSILSKRWKFLWMWLPKLEYDDTYYSQSERQRLRCFLNLNLRLHRAPVIESLRLKFIYDPIGSSIKPRDIKLWVSVAVSRRIHELSLNLSYLPEQLTRLPSSFYTCKSLVILKLEGWILLDVPRMVCLPSLKTLSLQRVSYSDESTLHKLLSNCPVLEDLYVGRDVTFRVIAPSLQRLTLDMYSYENFDGLMINTPSLKNLTIKDHSREDFRGYGDRHSYSYSFEDMPKLEEADIDMTYNSIDKFVTSITYVKRLSLCLELDTDNIKFQHLLHAYYREGIVFNQLEHLRICSCDENWSILLARLLKDSPNLRGLEVCQNNGHGDNVVDVCFENQLKCVPECLLSSLETFKWTKMYGSQDDFDMVIYILENARCLRTATISFQSERNYKMMYEELLLASRGSTTCQLVFDIENFI